MGAEGGKLGQCPDSVHQRPHVPGCPMSALWQERWDFNTEFFTTRRSVSSEEYPSSLTHSPVRVWGEKCTRYNKEGTWHGTWGFECRLLHTLSRIRIFPASAVYFQIWRAVNRIFEASFSLLRCMTIQYVDLKIIAWLSITTQRLTEFEYSSSSLQSNLFTPTPQIKQTYCQA